MSARVKAARADLEQAIRKAMDGVRKCSMPDGCASCARDLADAMKLADLYAYAALEADQAGAKP